MESVIGFSNFTLDMTENVGGTVALDNTAAALKRDLPEMEILDANPARVCIVGGGPSLDDTFTELREMAKTSTVWALNGTHDWLQDNGIRVDGAWCVDSRPDNVRFYRRPIATCTYFIASRCDAMIFDALAGHTVRLWHDATTTSELPPGKVCILGATTVGGKAMIGAFARGFREIHLFGYDSSYRADAHHAYPQPMNDGENVLDVESGGRKFRAAPWMINQVKNFGVIAPLLQKQGVDLHIHGDGLLPWIATSGHRLEEAA